MSAITFPVELYPESNLESVMGAFYIGISESNNPQPYVTQIGIMI